MISKKIGKKKQIIVIIITVIIALIGVCMAVFRNQTLINMPCSYICKKLEKEIPMGTSVEETVKILRSHEEWTDGNLYGDVHKYELMDGGFPIHSDQFEYESYASFNDVDYKSGSETNGLEYGSYEIRVYLGSTPFFEPFWGRSVNAHFIFDEEQKLIDIIVRKAWIGT